MSLLVGCSACNHTGTAPKTSDPCPLCRPKYPPNVLGYYYDGRTAPTTGCDPKRVFVLLRLDGGDTAIFYPTGGYHAVDLAGGIGLCERIGPRTFQRLLGETLCPVHYLTPVSATGL